MMYRPNRCETSSNVKSLAESRLSAMLCLTLHILFSPPNGNVRP